MVSFLILAVFVLRLSASLSELVQGDPVWPKHLNINEQLENVHHAGCSGLCSWNGFVDGYVIGTAPVCEARCDSDCSGRACLQYIPGNVAGWMPDAGAVCLNEAFKLAKVVFAERNESLWEKFEDLKMTPGKACCCATPLPRKDSFKKKEAPTPPGQTSCDDWCQQGGFGHGVTIGTAPACGASCDQDCPGQVCSSSSDFFSDHGSGCLTGDKVCCCAKKAPEHSVADMWKYSTEILDPPTMLASPFSCADLCSSGGYGGGWVSGTAPSCGGHCSDCNGGKCFSVSSGDVTDYGHGCWTGDKVCCCSRSQPSDETFDVGQSIV